MAKAKKKSVSKKSVRKSARKSDGRVKSKSANPRPAKKRARRDGAAGGVRLAVSAELDIRLRELATQMDKTLEEVLIQALGEFADNWEDHLRTVKNLNAGDDRMQLSVRPDDDNAP